MIDLLRTRAVEALEALGVTDANELLGEYSQKGPFLLLEKGEISSAEFYDLILPKCKPGTKCRDIRDALEQFLIGIPVERLRMLERLRKKGYRLFVLSNTNPVMYNHWIENEFRKDGKSVNDYFDGIVVSYQEGTCKPDPEIFKTVVARYGLKPQDTLMLDDSAANVESARSVGLNAINIKPEGEDSYMAVCERLLETEK